MENDPLTYVSVNLPTHGDLTLDPQTGAFTYTPFDHFHGTDSFTFRSFDETDFSDV